MSFGTWAAGPYTATWDTNDLGDVEGGWIYQRQASGVIIRADRYGETPIDGIYRGGQFLLITIIKEWTAATRSMLWPFSPTDEGLVGATGRSFVDMSKQLVLTAVTGSLAATNGPATRTIPRAIFAPEFNQSVLMGNDQRDVPIALQIFPTEVSASSSDLRLFTDT